MLIKLGCATVSKIISTVFVTLHYVTVMGNGYRGIVPFLHTYTSQANTRVHTTSVHSPSGLTDAPTRLIKILTAVLLLPPHSRHRYHYLLRDVLPFGPSQNRAPSVLRRSTWTLVQMTTLLDQWIAAQQKRNIAQ